jgi:CIC family chloride channel protein
MPDKPSQPQDEKGHSSSSYLNRFRKILPETTGFESQRYLIKWLFLSTLIGIVAGLSAILFTYSIDFVTKIALGKFTGYLPPSPVGEGTTGILPILRPWILPIVTTVGGLLSGIIVFSLAPEAEGHGTDAAIEAIHHKRGRIRSRIPPVKLVASAITIGTGGSGGREGPTAQMSAGFGSILADWLGLNVQDRRLAVCVGIGSGIGAIFRAPLGGALMAAEVLYIHDLEVEALIPTLMASIVGYSIYGAFYGYVPIFGNLGSLGFDHPIQLIYYAILGIVCGLGGLLYKWCFYSTVKLFHKMRWPRWVKPGIAGFIVGCIGLVIPGALHTGYGWVQMTLGKTLLGIPLWVVLLLPFAKILSTSLSIGSGGSGGIFGPGMVIGGFFGACFWRLSYHVFPGMPGDPASFVIIGMMALFGGVAHAPLAVMLMVAEMTGNLSLLAPAMVAVAISTAVVGDQTIYQSQLRSRAESPAHRVRLSFPLLSSLFVRDAMNSDPGPTISADASLADAEALMNSAHEDAVVVLDQTKPVFGLLRRTHIEAVNETERTGRPIRSLQLKDSTVFEPDHTLEFALDRMIARELTWAPVIENSTLAGRIQVREIMHTYKTTLERSVRRSSRLTPDTTMFEVRIEPDSALSGRTLRNAQLPKDTMVVSVTHEGKTIFPNADTKLIPGDKILIMTNPARERELRAFLKQQNHQSDSLFT